MDVSTLSPKEVGALGERIAAEYLRRRGFRIVDRNIARKTGEIDVIAKKGNTLHFVEVKTILCPQFPQKGNTEDLHDPSQNLHAAKIRKVARTSDWYMDEKRWEGESQIDGILVWVRRRDGLARVVYLPQLL